MFSDVLMIDVVYNLVANKLTKWFLYLYGFGFGMSFDWSSQTGAGSRYGCGGGGNVVVGGWQHGPGFVL